MQSRSHNGETHQWTQQEEKPRRIQDRMRIQKVVANKSAPHKTLQCVPVNVIWALDLTAQRSSQHLGQVYSMRRPTHGHESEGSQGEQRSGGPQQGSVLPANGKIDEQEPRKDLRQCAGCCSDT